MKNFINHTIKKLMAKIATLALLLGIISPLATVANDQNGQLQVNTNLNAAEYTIYDATAYDANDANKGVVMTGQGTKGYALNFGSYLVKFKDVAGYTTPSIKSANLTSENPNATVDGTYNRSNGMLQVNTNLNAATYKIYDATVFDPTDLNKGVIASGQGTKGYALGFGSYIVNFEKVAGYITPAEQVANLTSTSPSATVDGTYNRSNGMLQVNTNLNAATYKIYDATVFDPTDLNKGVIASGQGTKGYALGFGSYIVNFEKVAGYITPAEQVANLTSTSPSATVDGTYVRESQAPQPQQGTININVRLDQNGVFTDITDGDWEVFNCTDDTCATKTSVKTGTAKDSLTVNAGWYEFKAKAVSKYSKVSQNATKLELKDGQTIAFIATYEPASTPADYGTVKLTQKADANGAYGTIEIKGPTPGTANPNYDNNKSTPGDYTLSITAPAGFEEVVTNVGTGKAMAKPYLQNLVKNGTIEYLVEYKAITGPQGEIKVTQNGANAEVTLNGPSSATITGATYTNTGAKAGKYTLSFDLTKIPGFTVDKVTDALGNNLDAAKDFEQELEDGKKIEFNIYYKSNGSGSNYGTVEVKQTAINGQFPTVKVNGPNGTGFDVITAGDINTQATPGDHTITLTNIPAGYTAEVTDGTKTLNAPYSQNLAKGGKITYNITYKQTGGQNLGTVVVKQSGTAQPITIKVKGPNSTSYDVSKATDTQNAKTPGDYSLEFTTPTGYSVEVTDGTKALTTPYTQTLEANKTITFDVKFKEKGLFTIKKTATIQSTDPLNQNYVKYVVTVTREDNAAYNGEKIEVVLSDSISTQPTQGTLISNGGQLIYQNGQHLCSGDINCELSGQTQALKTGNVKFTFDPNTQGKKGEVTYFMRADNSAQTASATFTNTATISYTHPDPAKGAQTGSATATIGNGTRPTSGGGGSGGGGGGGGSYGGGGHVQYVGDMELKITREVSTDGSTFKPLNELALPKNKSTKLTVRMTIENPFHVSAKNVTFKPYFTPGKSKMTAGAIDNLKGAKINSYNNIVMESIQVTGKKSFTYDIIVKSSNVAAEPAIEGLELIDFSSKLANYNSGVKYLGIGTKYNTKLFNGTIPRSEQTNTGTTTKPSNSGNASKVLAISVQADKSGARIGDTIQYTIRAKNVSDDQLTNLLLTHRLPNEMSVNKADGATVDKNEATWRRAILRPGQTATFTFSAKLNAGTPGTRVKSLTRAMANEYERIAPVASYMNILGGAPSPAQTGSSTTNLAQTGPMTNLMLLILSAIAYLVYGQMRKRDYAYMKRKALEF